MEEIRSNRDLTRRLWQLSYPTMISAALESLYEIVDMIWIGRISDTAMSGVTLFSTVFYLFAIFNDIIGMGSVSLISQAYGRKDDERIRLVSEQTVAFKAFMGVISAILLFFLIRPLLGFYSEDPLVIRDALAYGNIRILFVPITFASFSINTIFRCSGDSKTPMKIMFFSTVLNLVLDPVLMFEKLPFFGLPGFGLGVFGAGAATVLSNVIALAVGLHLLLRGHNGIRIRLKGIFTLHPEIDRSLLSVGLPAGVESLSRTLSGAILIKFVSTYGKTAIAVAGIGGRLFGVAIMPIIGFSMGGSVLVGQFLGEENIEGAVRISKVASRLCTSVMVAFVALTWLFSTEIMRVFGEDPDILLFGSEMLRITSFALLLAGISYSRMIVFTGSGYTFPVVLSSIGSRWIGQLLFLWYAVSLRHSGLSSVWGSYILAGGIELLITLFFYHAGKWKYKRV